jgi:hypothetical protein
VFQCKQGNKYDTSQKQDKKEKPMIIAINAEKPAKKYNHLTETLNKLTKKETYINTKKHLASKHMTKL